MQIAGEVETDKVRLYQSLVLKRKSCHLCEDSLGENRLLTNPSDTAFDKDEIGPYSVWQHDLDADILIVGRDWGCVDEFKDFKGENAPNPNEYGFPMDEWLSYYLSMIGIPVGHPLQPKRASVFLTNAILCVKAKNAANQMEQIWLDNCGRHLLKSLIDIVKPTKLIITLGKHAYASIMRLYDRPVRGFTAAVNKAVSNRQPIDLGDGLKLFPVFIPGGQGFISRSSERQEKDWRSIRYYLETLRAGSV
jgi:uracil-DNA glycosylase